MAAWRTEDDPILAVLRSGRFDELKGVEEGQHVDFKLAWDLDIRKDVRSLIADVAAFANSGGGVLVVGVKCAKDPFRQIEAAADVVGVDDVGALSAERIRKLIGQHCRPLVYVDVTHHSGVADRRSINLVAIAVQGQDPLHAPVLAQRLVDVDDLRVPEAIGWPQRHGDGTEWVPTARLQQLVSTGLHLERHLASAVLAEPVRDESSREQFDLLADFAAEHETSTYVVVQLVPTSLVRIDDFYGDFADRMRRWSPVRPNGFGRWIPAEPVDGVLASLDSRRSVSVGPNGVVTGLAAGLRSFLGWASTSSDDEPITINAYPLIEFVAEVIRFAHGVVGPHVVPAMFGIRMVGTGLRQTRIDLNPGRGFFEERRLAVRDDVDIEVAGTGDWDADAFEALARFLQNAYAVPRREIPWQTDQRIDLGLMD